MCFEENIQHNFQWLDSLVTLKDGQSQTELCSKIHELSTLVGKYWRLT